MAACDAFAFLLLLYCQLLPRVALSRLPGPIEGGTLFAPCLTPLARSCHSRTEVANTLLDPPWVSAAPRLSGSCRSSAEVDSWLAGLQWLGPTGQATAHPFIISRRRECSGPVAVWRTLRFNLALVPLFVVPPLEMDWLLHESDRSNSLVLSGSWLSWPGAHARPRGVLASRGCGVGA